MADQIETGDASPPSDLGEDASVEVIHRPKLIHGLRELATEVGVIVIGIAIALGGQQTLEWLHQRTEVSEARHALRSEIAFNANAARHTVVRERCYSAGLEKWVAWANGGPHAVLDGRYNLISFRTNNWEVVKAGAAAHMPLAERLSYSRFYDFIENDRPLLDNEREIGFRLGGYTGRTTLTPADAQRVLEDVKQARPVGTFLSGGSFAILRAAKAMGVEPEPMAARTREDQVAYCRAVGITPDFPTSLER